MNRPMHSDTVQSEKLKALLDELNQPLDTENWTSTPYTAGTKATTGLLDRVRRHRHHRKELKRARRAAASAFKTKPRLSTRKRASLMMGAGALSLGAFTGPPTQGSQAAAVSTSAPMQTDATQTRQPADNLTASDEFKQALIEEEGIRYTVYRDVAGYPTVGVGHLVLPEDNLRLGDRISEKRVLKLLDQDLAKAETGVRKLVGDLKLYQHEFDALLDLVYNVGIGNVSEKQSPRLNAAINAGDYEGIAEELDYSYAAGKIARGLEFRSQRRAKIFMDASYDNPRNRGKTSADSA